MKTKIVESVQEVPDNPDAEFEIRTEVGGRHHWKKWNPMIHCLDDLLSVIDKKHLRRILPEDKPETVEFVWMCHGEVGRLEAIPLANVEAYKAMGWRVVNAVTGVVSDE